MNRRSTMRDFGADMPEPDPSEAVVLAGIGLPDDEITTWHAGDPRGA